VSQILLSQNFRPFWLPLNTALGVSVNREACAMGSILIHQTDRVSDIAGLSEVIDEIGELAEIKIRTSHVSAVAGELAGTAIEILLSPTTQALLNAAALGALLWKVISLLGLAGKKVFISKDLTVPLIASKVKDELEHEFDEWSENIRIWGPMEAEITDGPAANCIEEYEEALGQIAYFIALAIPKPNNRVKTIYYLLGAGGKLCGSWTTQTYIDRVPEFLRPNP